MTLMRYSFREARRRPGRTVLTLLGIVIGVQALVAIPLTVQSTRQAQRGLFEGLTGRAALEVVPCGEGGFSPELGSHLETLQDVKAAIPVVESTAALWGPSGLVPVMALGVDMQRDGQARDYVLSRGNLLQHEGQLLLEKTFASSLQLEVGGTARLLTPSGAAELRVAGLLEPRGAAAVNGGAVVIMPLETAQQLFGLDGQINSLNLVLAEGSDTGRIAQEVAQHLPPGLTVQAPAARAALAQETMANTERMLAVLSITSLVAGAFVILNSFLMSLGERRRALAILRSLGATRKQVTRLLVSEALALGVVGTAVGILIGLVAAFAMTHLMGQLTGPVVPQLRLTAGPILLAGLLGPGVAVLSTYFPARVAGHRSPLAELRERPEVRSAREAHARRWPGYLGLGLLATFALSYAIILIGHVPGDLFVLLLPAGMALAMVGSVMAIPVVLGPLTRVAQGLLRPVLGIEAGLAIRQLRRHPTRTSLVVGVLMISVMLSTGFGNAILNSVRDAREWMVRVFAHLDFLVVPTALSGTELLPVAIPEEYADRIGELRGVRRVGKGSVFSTRAAGYPITVFARSCQPGEDLGFRFMNGADREVREQLRRGAVVIGTALARRTGLLPGDQISIDTREGPHLFTIAGLTPEYTAGGLIALIEWDHAKRFFDLEGVRYIYVVADPDDRAGVEQRLRAFCDEHKLLLHSRAGFTVACDELMAGALNSAWVLMALVFVVASLGITNCLTMNVLEQTRELGILRAIAMKRRQVGKLVVAQAMAVGVISIVPGVLLGVLMGYATTSATYAVSGVPVPYVLEPALLAGCAAMALLVAVLASLAPARRAARLSIVRALQYE
jgi:putative ABC transport system permease protein